MSDEQHSPLFQPVGADDSPAADTSPAQHADLLPTMQRIATAVEELRGRVETLTREQRHRQFSPGRLIGAVLEVVVLGLVIVAVADWVYGESVAGQLVKLALAGVLQLGALTAFILGRDTP